MLILKFMNDFVNFFIINITEKIFLLLKISLNLKKI
jgi:hypothetical protein